MLNLHQPHGTGRIADLFLNLHQPDGKRRIPDCVRRHLTRLTINALCGGMSASAYALIDPSAPMVSGWRLPLPNSTSGLYVPASRLLRGAERVTPDKRLALKLMTTSATSSLWRRRKAAAPPVALTGVKSPLPSAGRVVCNRMRVRYRLSNESGSACWAATFTVVKSLCGACQGVPVVNPALG
jgi:hypothetical protein